MNITLLEWDSDFFKLKIGKLELENLSSEQYKELLKQKEIDKYDLIYLFLSEQIDSINSEMPFLADKKVIYHKNIIPTTHAKYNSHISNYNGAVCNDLISLALASGHESRFKKDARLNNKFNDFYTTWLKKAIDGSMADSLFIHQTKYNINGFVTVKNRQGTGQIGLIAVDEKYRGKGIGINLLNAAEKWYQSKDIKHCEVVTQLDNTGACRLYEKFGYSIKNIQYIYHI